MTPGVTLPALVATDLDGTLLRTDGTLSERSRRALVARRGRGRAHRGGHGPAAALDARLPRHRRPARRGAVRQRCLRLPRGRAAAAGRADARRPSWCSTWPRCCATACPARLFAVETAEGFGREAGLRRPVPAAAGDAGRPARPARWRSRRASCWRATRRWLRRCSSTACATCSVRQAVLAYSGADGLAEISAPGRHQGSRAGGLVRAARRRGRRRVWAFGDMPNDLSMLTWAGRGHAVANAHPEVLAAADAVCPSQRRRRRRAHARGSAGRMMPDYERAAATYDETRGGVPRAEAAADGGGSAAPAGSVPGRRRRHRSGGTRSAAAGRRRRGGRPLDGDARAGGGPAARVGACAPTPPGCRSPTRRSTRC